MNERIKELAFQAGFVGESMNPIFGTCQETALKNFAELIVRECANIDFRFKVGMTTDQESDTGRVILEHFDLK